MHAATQRSVCFLALLAFASFPLGSCQPQSPPSTYETKALQLAGVDLLYTFRRLAAESGMLLAVDELRAASGVPDLEYFRVDIDIPAGPVNKALDLLKEATEDAFDYRIFDNVIYVRSRLSVTHETGLDTKVLNGGHFEGHIDHLIQLIMRQHPSALIHSDNVRGAPQFRKISIDIPPKSSALDVLITYAKAAEFGWRIRRGAFQRRTTDGELGIAATTFELMDNLKAPERLSRFKTRLTATEAIADLAERTQTPIVIKDRSILGDIRSQLDLERRLDPQTAVTDSLEALAVTGPRRPELLNFSDRDGVYVVRSHAYTEQPTGEAFLQEKLNAGKFTGTLPLLARWLVENRKEPSTRSFMAGENYDGMPEVSFEITDGQTIEDALMMFARKSGKGWVYIAFDNATPGYETIAERPKVWQGGFLAPLKLWAGRNPNAYATK